MLLHLFYSNCFYMILKFGHVWNTRYLVMATGLKKYKSCCECKEAGYLNISVLILRFPQRLTLFWNTKTLKINIIFDFDIWFSSHNYLILMSRVSSIIKYVGQKRVFNPGTIDNYVDANTSVDWSQFFPSNSICKFCIRRLTLLLYILEQNLEFHEYGNDLWPPRI